MHPPLWAAINTKGGTGKSNGSQSLAAIACLRNIRTILIDGDEQGTSRDWFATRRDSSPLAGLPVVGADRNLSLSKIRTITRGYELAIADTGPRSNEVTKAILVAASLALVPIRPGLADWLALDATIKLMDSADELRASIDLPPLRRVYLVNGIVSRTNVAARFRETMAGVDGELAPESIPTRMAYVEAMAAGEAVSTTHPGSPADLEMRRLFAFLEAR
jgi:chromosome partitioning protein